MQLTRFTDIGLRVLMRLAADHGDTTYTARGLATELQVPQAHVAKVVSRLSEMGVVHARRGRRGGLTITPLGRTAGVGWVTRRLEGDAEVVDCTSPAPCPLQSVCRLRGALAEAQNAFYESLDALTVADLVVGQDARLLPLISRAQPARAGIATAGDPHSPLEENRNRR